MSLAARQEGNMSKEREITGRHVLIGLIVFFGVILAANAAFLYTALSTYSGVVSDEPYRKGLAYNQRIEADKEQQSLGWSGEITLAGSGNALDIVVADSKGNPISRLGFEGRIGRPSTAAMDIALEVKETAPGRYEAAFATLEAGTWQVDLAAKELTRSGDKIVWRARKRITWTKP